MTVLSCLLATAGVHPIAFGASRDPNAVRLKVDPNVARGAINRAMKDLRRKIDLPALEQALPKLAKGGKSSEVPAELEKSFRAMRKPAKAMRSLLVWLDDRHDRDAVGALPFATFVTELGKLNSAIGAGVSSEIAKRSEKTLAVMRGANFDSDIAQFVPTTNASFQTFLQGELSKVRKELRSPTISAKKFHEIRKTVRGLYFSLHFAREASTEPRALASAEALLERISGDMADVHEKQEKRGLRGKIDYDHFTFDFPAGIRGDLETMLASFDAR